MSATPPPCWASACRQAGAPCWLDLMTSDVDRAKDFYGKLLGWEFEQGDEEKYGGYVTATKNGELVAGIMASLCAHEWPGHE